MYPIHWSGAHYYYTDRQGQIISKGYTTLSRLRKYAKPCISFTTREEWERLQKTKK